MPLSQHHNALTGVGIVVAAFVGAVSSFASCVTKLAETQPLQKRGIYNGEADLIVPLSCQSPRVRAFGFRGWPLIARSQFHA